MLSLASNAIADTVASFGNVWRASDMARSNVTTHTTGFTMLDAELPRDGWPRSTLIELLPQRAGIGEMQLLKPVLAELSAMQRIALIQPPYRPQVVACTTWGFNATNLLWMRPTSSADALWTTEQILKNGSCGAVILWQTNIRAESLRRLNLAAQSSETWFWVVRPITCSADASPSALRMALRPALGGLSLEIVKRRGPHQDHPLFIPLADMPAGRQLLDENDARVVKRTPAFVTARSATPVLV